MRMCVHHVRWPLRLHTPVANVLSSPVAEEPFLATTPGDSMPSPRLGLTTPQEECLFLPDDELIPEPPPTSDTPPPTQVPTLSDEALGQWLRTLWPEGLELLSSFENKSWGTAYRTIADVQVLLMIGKRLKMEVNLATHSVSPGTYIESDGQRSTIQFATLGRYLNKQAEGTWTNKLTFFFAVYHFLCETELATEETLGSELWEAREAMLTWGVSLKAPISFLDAGDNNAMRSKTKLHSMIREYMVSR